MFLHVVNSLPDAVLVVTDENGDDRIEWANDAAGKLLSTRPEQLTQTPLTELMHQADVARVRSRLQLKNAEPFRADFVRPHDGSSIIVDARVTTQQERFEGLYLLSAREVRAAGQLEHLLADLQTAVLGADPRAIADGRALVRALDPVFRARRWSGSLWEVGDDAAVMRHVISGWGMGREAWRYAQSLVGQPVPYAQIPVLREVVKNGRGVFFDDVEQVMGNIAEQKPGDATLAERVAGSLRARRLSRGAWAPVVTRRGVTHVLTVVGVGMTEADFAAALLIANQIGAWMTMSELSAKIAHDEHQTALAEMSSVVAHEIRAPALILETTARRLEQQVAGDTRLEPSISLLRRQIATLDGVVGRLLEHGKQLAELREPAPVSRAIERALAELEITPAQDRVEVAVPSPAPVVRADPILLAHAIAELVQNALEHAPPGGRVRIKVEGYASPDGEEARIMVQNDGGGVDPHVAAHMFEPFFSTKGKSGLGLAVARRVAAALRGRLELDRSEGGASMSLWVPIEPRLLSAPRASLAETS
jgi:signal transduction histidine kinase